MLIASDQTISTRFAFRTRYLSLKVFKQATSQYVPDLMNQLICQTLNLTVHSYNSRQLITYTVLSHNIISYSIQVTLCQVNWFNKLSGLFVTADDFKQLAMYVATVQSTTT